MNEVKTINSICYQGKVDLYILKKNKKQVHIATLNKGLIGISELFTRACLGYSVEPCRPKKLDLINESTNNSVLVAPVELRAASFSWIPDTPSNAPYGGWKYPIFDALILTSNMQEIENGYYKIKLLSGSTPPLEIAEIEIYIANDSSAPDGVTAPVLHRLNENNILIRWSMYLSNREDN